MQDDEEGDKAEVSEEEDAMKDEENEEEEVSEEEEARQEKVICVMIRTNYRIKYLYNLYCWLPVLLLTGNKSDEEIYKFVRAKTIT